MVTLHSRVPAFARFLALADAETAGRPAVVDGLVHGARAWLERTDLLWLSPVSSASTATSLSVASTARPKRQFNRSVLPSMATSETSKKITLLRGSSGPESMVSPRPLAPWRNPRATIAISMTGAMPPRRGSPQTDLRQRVGITRPSPIDTLHAPWPHLHGSLRSPMPRRHVGPQ